MRNVPGQSLASLLPAWCHTPIFSLRTAKELRVVFPISLVGCILVGLSANLSEGWEFLIAIVANGIACSAIGAMAAGHDFHYRTLNMSLALPIDRAAIWRKRMALAFLAMLPVVGVSVIISFLPILARTSVMSNPIGFANIAAFYFLPPLLGGMFLAPWLTLLSRSVLFGAIFSLAIPYLLLALANMSGLTETPSATFSLVGAIMGILWIVGGIAGRRKFLNLESLDDREIGGARATSRAAVRAGRRRSPIGQLFLKELRLQQVPLGLCAVAVVIAFLLKNDEVALWTMIYAAVFAVLVGSVASADERQTGTSEWQILLPISFWKQWTLKTITTLTLGGLLGGVIPVAILHIMGGQRHLSDGTFLEQACIFGGWAMFLSAVGFYSSSFCASGLKAMLIALPIALMTSGFMMSSDFLREYAALFHNNDGLSWFNEWRFWPVFGLVAGLAVIVMRFAGINHRYADRGPDRAASQFVWIGGYLLASYLFLFGLATLFERVLLPH